MENGTDAPVIAQKGTFPATVAKVIDDYKLVINKGAENGIREGQRMLVYFVSDEDIKDPNTGESLGYLELVRGTGKIIFLQDKIAILESDKVQYKRYCLHGHLDFLEDLVVNKLLKNHKECLLKILKLAIW